MHKFNGCSKITARYLKVWVWLMSHSPCLSIRQTFLNHSLHQSHVCHSHDCFMTGSLHSGKKIAKHTDVHDILLQECSIWNPIPNNITDYHLPIVIPYIEELVWSINNCCSVLARILQQWGAGGCGFTSGYGLCPFPAPFCVTQTHMFGIKQRA